MPGKLTEPMVIQDFNRDPVCILPVGFYLDDHRWEKIWAFYEEKGAPITRMELRALFPEEPALREDRMRSPDDPA